MGFGIKAEQNKNKAIEALISEPTQLLEANKQIEAMIASIKAIENLREIDAGNNDAVDKLRNSVIDKIRESNRFQGHKEEVNSVSFSPDGKTIASASQDTTIKLWNIETGESKPLENYHKKSVWRVRYSPMNGNMIASSDIGGTAILWAADTGRFLRRLKGHTDIIYDLSFSPNSETIATASWDGTIKIWDTSTGKEQETLENIRGQDKVYSLDFNSDATKLASGGYKDGSVKLWDLKSRTSKVIGQHQKPATFVRFSPDGQIIASSSNDGVIQLWKEGQLLRNVKAHEKSISGLAFSPNGKVLASASQDGTIKLWLWQLDGIQIKILVAHTGGVNEINFCHNNEDYLLLTSASEDTTVRFWKVNVKKITQSSPRIEIDSCPKCEENNCNEQDCRNNVSNCCI